MNAAPHTATRIDVFARLHAMLADPTWRRLLGSIEARDIPDLVDFYLADQPAAVLDALDLAAARAGSYRPGAALEILGHQFHCFAREARAIDRQPVNRQVNIHGAENLANLDGAPISFLCPMSVMTSDGMAAIDAITNSVLPGRPFITYGENMDALIEREPRFAAFFPRPGANPMREILDVFNRDGIFFTYCDFAYAGHRTVAPQFLGGARVFSRGFVKLLQKTRPILIATHVTLDGDVLNVHCEKPIVSLREGLSTPSLDAVSALVSNATARLVNKLGPQWLLLPTLAFEPAEMAAAEQ